MHAGDRRRLLQKEGKLPATFSSAFSSQHPLVNRESSFDTSFTGVNDIEFPDASLDSEALQRKVPQFSHNFSNVLVNKDSPVPFVQTKAEAGSEGETLSSEVVSDINA